MNNFLSNSKKCHDYGHFVKKFPKVDQEEAKKTQEEGWKQTKNGKKSSVVPQPNPKVDSVSQPRESISNQFQAL